MTRPISAKPTSAARVDKYSAVAIGLVTGIAYGVAATVVFISISGIGAFEPPWLFDTLVMLAVVGGAGFILSFLLGAFVSWLYRWMLGPAHLELLLVPAIGALVVLGLLLLLWFVNALQFARV
jgi:hypothetical protein